MEQEIPVKILPGNVGIQRPLLQMMLVPREHVQTILLQLLMMLVIHLRRDAEPRVPDVLIKIDHVVITLVHKLNAINLWEVM